MAQGGPPDARLHFRLSPERHLRLQRTRQVQSDDTQTPGGTRTPNLLIRSHTVLVPAGTSQSHLVMSCRNFCRSSSRLIPASTAQSYGVALHSGCSQSRPYVPLWAGELVSRRQMMGRRRVSCIPAVEPVWAVWGVCRQMPPGRVGQRDGLPTRGGSSGQKKRSPDTANPRRSARHLVQRR
jgi:hypothetical protein